MKKFFCFVILILIQACVPNVQSVTNDNDGTFMTASRDMDNLINIAPGMLWNGIQYVGFAYSLSSNEKQLHKKSVYHALNHALDGELVHWKSNNKNVSGKIRVIHSYPISNGYCRIYQAYITKKSRTNFFTNQACSSMGNRWVFNR